MIMHAKHIQERVKAQLERRWVKFRNAELGGKTIGIIGPGHIGHDVARDERPPSTCACSRPVGRTSRARRYRMSTRSLPTAGLAEMLAQCDYVVVAVSLTPETRGLIGEPELRAMKPGAFFINVSREGPSSTSSRLSAH